MFCPHSKFQQLVMYICHKCFKIIIFFLKKMTIFGVFDYGILIRFSWLLLSVGENADPYLARLQDFRSDLTAFLAQYPGAQLRVLELRNMDEPLEMRYLSEECPNLERLKVNFGHFRSILVNSGQIRSNPVNSSKLRPIQVNSCQFLSIPINSEPFRSIPVNYRQ